MGAPTGWVLPDDVDPEPPVEPWAALLPALDPTTMGWKDRDFYVDPDFAPAVFDWAGNVGTTGGGWPARGPPGQSRQLSPGPPDAPAAPRRPHRPPAAPRPWSR